MPNAAITPELLRAALSGLEAQKTRLQDRIDALKRLLEQTEAEEPSDAKAGDIESAPAESGDRPHISPGGRARISAAHIERWARLKVSLPPKSAGK